MADPPETAQSFNQKGPTVTAFETIDEGPRAFGVKVHSNDVCGVYGESMANPPAVGERENAVTPRTGVLGRGDEKGVEGLAGKIGVEGVADKIGVSGQSLSGSSVVSGIGVLGSSDRNRAGVFMGKAGFLEDEDIDQTLRSSESGPQQHPAQLRLVPYDDRPLATRLPKNGLGGDFFAVTTPNNQVLLWFCIQNHGPDPEVNPALWVRIAFLPTGPGGPAKGGDPAV